MTPRTQIETGAAPLRPGIVDPLDRYAPVLALTILRETDAGREILCAVRRPEANATHQNVLSVPTVRVERSIADAWPEASEHGQDVPGLATVVKMLLMQKLGLADAFELDPPRYRFGRYAAWQGKSFIDIDANGCDVHEDLTMFNVEVLIDRDSSDAIGRVTASYDPIVWTPVQRFLDALQTRDVSCIGQDLDQVLVCIRGLCVESTTRLLLESA